MIAAPTTPLPLLRDGIWRVIRSQSELGFAIRHLGVATVRGTFAGFGGELLAARDGIRIAGRADAATVDTGEPLRDQRLRDELFECDRFPRIELAARCEPPTRGADWRLDGTLTMHGRSRPIVLVGVVEEHGEGVRALLEGSIRRSDFGLDWLALGEPGRRLISDRVRLHADVTLVHAASQPDR